MVMLISLECIACSPTNGQITAETESAPELDNKEFERRLAELRQKGRSREAVRLAASFACHYQSLLQHLKVAYSHNGLLRRLNKLDPCACFCS